MRTIYLDYNATTPLDPAVRDAMQPYLGAEFGNPSSLHRLGRAARAAMDDARDRIAGALGCKPGELLFTSGGTESNNTAILGLARRLRARGRHLVTSSVEHHSVLRCFEHLHQHEGFDLSVLPVDREGLLDPADLRQALRPDTILVSVIAANNEIGTLQPLAELASICRDRGVAFHTDAAQWFGKLPLSSVQEFGADGVSLCAHKFHGPKGAGLLYLRSPLQLEPLLRGGPQEAERRAGTENVAACVGLAEAVERFIPEPVFPCERLRDLTASLALALEQVPGVTLCGSGTRRLPNTLALTVEGCDSLSLLAGLDLEGICASSGSACSAGSLSPSHVVLALGVPISLASCFLRFSLGRETLSSDIEVVRQVLPLLVQRVRAVGKAAGSL